MHSDIDESGVCSICNKVFRKKSYIQHHIKLGIKEHECPYCYIHSTEIPLCANRKILTQIFQEILI